MKEIIYVYDALCGWCYGFSPVMQKLHEKYHDQFMFTVLSGGMITGSRIGSINEKAAYIRNAYKVVEDRTGVKFGKAFVEDVLAPGTMILSSELPSLAMTYFKTQLPDKQIQFAHALQNAIYYDGKDLNQLRTYEDLAATFDLDGKSFVKKITSEPNIHATNEEFKRVAQYGINGFPTVIYNDGKNLYAIARGYTSYEDVAETLEDILVQHGTNNN